MYINKNLIQNYDLNDEAGYIDMADEDFTRYGNTNFPVLVVEEINI